MKWMNGIAVAAVMVAGLGAQTSRASADDLFKEANAAMRAEDWKTAEFWFRDLRKNYPADTRWGLGLLSALQAENRYADALQVAREIAPQYPRSAVHSQRIGRLLVLLDRPQEALTEFQAGMRYAQTPTEMVGLYAGMGDAYQGLDRIDDGIGAYRKAKELSGGRGIFPLAFPPASPPHTAPPCRCAARSRKI